jgi:hypothetical protein
LPALGKEYLPGIKWPEPVVVTPSAEKSQPPSDAMVLFDGSDFSRWENGENWRVEEGAVYVGKGNVTSKDKFGDCQVHIEWSSPPSTDEEQGQARGNSGVFLMGMYEIQVLDSYSTKTYFDGQAGAIYKQTPPMVNAMRPAGEWNAYDIVWTRPRFDDDGSLKSPAYITALHNGIVILNHFKLSGDTPYDRPPQYSKHADKMPISLQDHGNPVRYRNIWVREIKPIVGKQAQEPSFKDHETGKTWPASTAQTSNE